jgi:hypothetical protein
MSILSTRQAFRAVNIYISDAQDKSQSRGQTKEEVSSAKAEVVFYKFSKLSFYCCKKFLFVNSHHTV